MYDSIYVIYIYVCPNQSDYGQREAILTQQVIATALWLQQQLYVYGWPGYVYERPVWGRF